MVPSCSIYSRHHECLATRHDWAWAYRTAPVGSCGILCFQVEGEILHYSAGVGAFVNVGAAIDGVTPSLPCSVSWVLRVQDGMLVSVACLSTQHNPETQHAFSMKCWIYCGLFSYRIPWNVACCDIAATFVRICEFFGHASNQAQSIGLGRRILEFRWSRSDFVCAAPQNSW